MNKKIKYLIVFIFIWIAVTSTIQRLNNPNLTETQLFLRIPKSMIFQFI